MESPLNQPCILWVDDNPRNNTLIARNLRRAGIRIESASSTRSALQRMQEGLPDLVISDMARVEDGILVANAGFELTHRIRMDGMSIPILIFCGRFNPVLVMDPQACGVACITADATVLLREILQRIGPASASLPNPNPPVGSAPTAAQRNRPGRNPSGCST